MLLKSKLVLSMLTLLGMGASLSTQSVYKKDNQEQTLLKNIESNIQDGSFFSREEKIYNYKNQEYKNYNTVVQQLVAPNSITAIKTTSNPNKIIKNYETEILDESQLYSTDFDEYVKVYKNALGKVVLPNCPSVKAEPGCVVADKSQIDRTLDSYVNPGLTNIEFSYDYGENPEWFDNELEAQESYQNKEFGAPQASLFYNINGTYYNAFNQRDLTALEHNGFLTPTLHYYNLTPQVTTSQVSSGNQISDLDSFWASQSGADNFQTKLFEKIFSLLTNNKQNIDQIFTSTGNYYINLLPDGSDFISKLQLRGVDQQQGLGNNKITITEELRKDYSIDPSTIIETIKNSAGWIRKEHWSSGFIDCKDYVSYEKEIKLVDALLSKDGTAPVLDIEVSTPGDGCTKGGFATPNLGKMQVTTDLNEVDLSLNETPTLNIVKQLFATSLPFSKSDTNDLNFQTNLIYEILNNSPFPEDVVRNETAKYGKVSNWNISFIKTIFKLYFDKMFANIETHLDNLAWLKKDYAYGGNDNLMFSLNDQQLDFVNNKLTATVTAGKTDNDEIHINGIGLNADSFTTTLKNWKNNFYYLSGDQDSPIPLVPMYFIANKKTSDIADFSALDPGAIIANSAAEVSKLAMYNQNAIERKQYVIYNLNGQLLAIADNSDLAYAQLRNEIALNYKLLSKKELANYQDQDVDWNDVISDGEYTVYKLTNSLNQKFYFKSYEQALAMYINSLVQTNEIQTETRLIYSYSIMLNGQLKTYEWWTNDQVEQIALEIMQNIKEMSKQ